VIEFLTEDIELPFIDIVKIKKWIYFIIENHDFIPGSIAIFSVPTIIF